MNNKTKTRLISYYDEELDQVIADAIEHFAQSNIRFRSPNRSVNYANQQKFLKKLAEEH